MPELNDIAGLEGNHAVISESTIAAAYGSEPAADYALARGAGSRISRSSSCSSASSRCMNSRDCLFRAAIVAGVFLLSYCH